MKFIENNLINQFIRGLTKLRQLPMKSLWKKIPEQVRRLLILNIVLISLFLIVRSVLIPPDFGEYGHYRTSAMKEITSQQFRYAGQDVCIECHEDLVETKTRGFHKNLSCEVCHGPAVEHTEDPGSVELLAPRGRGYCPLCHEYLPSRPTGFPQIVSDSHNPMKPCIICHNPHSPEPPETPKECAACHAQIARTKALSHHVYVPCIRCHQTPEEHKTQPRRFLPAKPATREFCGGCHAQDAPAGEGIPRIDLATHQKRYVCWQCHYPHLPEGR